MEEQRRRAAEEERNRRAAQDFSRMSLAGAGGGAQPAAPHAPQHYPPAYQVCLFAKGSRGRHGGVRARTQLVCGACARGGQRRGLRRQTRVIMTEGI